ncbi:MAG: hypothetical protein GXP18_03475, partial [Gammaproteobacteria bacterium]|nr:hypothetical protein [Gammaproteobacteria bacterium]
MAYLLGSQQQMIATENTLTTIPEKETSVFVANTVPQNTKINVLPTTVQSVKNPITETVVKTDSVMMVKEKMIKTVIKEPVAEKIISMTARPVIENFIEKTSANDEQNINKTIRPLTDEQHSQLAFQRAIHLLSRDNQQEAQLALVEALSFSPVHFRARETLAALLLNAGRMSEAA